MRALGVVLVSLGCLVLSPSSSSAERRLHKVLRKVKLEGSFWEYEWAPLRAIANTAPRDLLEQIIGSHDYRETKALCWWL